MTSKISIVGSAARKSDSKILRERGQYDRMLHIAQDVVKKNGIIYGASGGAAWSDHILVSLGLMRAIDPKNITLFTPAPFNLADCMFYGNKDAETSNYYHKKFSEAVGLPSLVQIGILISAGCRVNVGHGFQDRNSDIAHYLAYDDILLAYTTGNGKTAGVPSYTAKEYDGVYAVNAGLKMTRGTADTWDKATCRKLHVIVD